jgi:DNA invertase Pin-like site-specific DNA recombinase
MPIDKAQIRKLRKEGYSYRKIGDTLNCSHVYVLKVLNAKKVKLKRPDIAEGMKRATKLRDGVE